MAFGAEVFSSTEPISIVGIGCSLPGNIGRTEDLYTTLRDGRLCVTKVPADRWDADTFYDPDPLTPGKTYVRHGGFVEDIDRFDAAFFGISDSEASRMDPQQRMALQTVWHALEDAGQASEELVRSNTGVFVAMMNTNGYAQLKTAYEGLNGITAYDAMADAMSITAGRISHFLGLEGPCLAVDTACSGSMVAVHLARQSILAGDCDSAIAVGINAILHPGIHIAFSKVGLMSRAGTCRAFDEAADGYVRGEGCVAVVLRRQAAAMARGDRIIANILGTAINQDGKTPALTAPNGLTQEKVIRSALAAVGIDPTEVGYVEAHGTGTPVGDPIEMSALAKVYGQDRPATHPLFVGSAKTNFGHLESAGGLLGLVKAALSLHYETIFPSLNFNRLNPNIDLGGAPIEVPTTVHAWPRNGRRRLAGVNSFGYSGTNAHALLEEGPPGDHGGQLLPGRPSELVVLSAKTAASLREVADRWAAFLGEDAGRTPLSDVAFTSTIGRTHMRHRLAVVGRSGADISEKIRAWQSGHALRGVAAGQVRPGRTPKVAFVFTGQGSQYPGMTRQLYENEQLFKASLDRCAGIMDPLLGLPLLDVLFGTAPGDPLSDTRYVQPALFAVGYALAALLRQWGVEPDVLIGHSIGEVVAACVSGALDLESAIPFVVGRGRLMGELPRDGKMLAVEATPEEARQWIDGMQAHVSLAAVNGPHSVVVSGRGPTVDAVAEIARRHSRWAKELNVSHAFHSPLMEPILDELECMANALPVSRAVTPVISNVTGREMDGDFDGRYWRSHVRNPVLFHEGMSSIFARGCSIIVELGPHPALVPAIISAFDTTKVRCVPTLMRDQYDVAHILESLGELHVAGVRLDWDRVFSSPTHRRVPLPLYPFRRDRHWLASDLAVEQPPKIQPKLHPVLGRASSLDERRAVFESSMTASFPWADHRVLGATVFPGTGYLEMAARGYAAFKGGDWQPVVLQDVQFERPLILAYRKPATVRLTLEDIPGSLTGEAEFAIRAACDEGSEQMHCRGRVALARDGQSGNGATAVLDRSIATNPLGIGQFYGDLRKVGLEYGANFSTIRELWLGAPRSGTAIGRLTRSPYVEEADNHPFAFTTVLDGCLQVFGAALRTLEDTEVHGAYIPASIRSVTVRKPPGDEAWARATVQTNVDGRAALVHIQVFGGDGELLVDIDGVELRRKESLASTGTTAGGNGSTAEASTESRDELVARLKTLPPEGRVPLVAVWLAAEVKATMGQAAEDLDLDDLDLSTAFLEIGLDSLLVTELQRRIQEKLDFRFEPMQGLDYQSIESLAEFILDTVLAVDRNGAAVRPEINSSDPPDPPDGPGAPKVLTSAGELSG